MHLLIFYTSNLINYKLYDVYEPCTTPYLINEDIINLILIAY